MKFSANVFTEALNFKRWKGSLVKFNTLYTDNKIEVWKDQGIKGDKILHTKENLNLIFWVNSFGQNG